MNSIPFRFSCAPLAAAITLTCVIGMAPAGWAGQATLTWNANTEQDLWGYKIYHGTSPGSYSDSVLTGLTATPDFPQYTVINLTDGSSYYFVVTALDTFGNESAFSNEVSKTIGSASEGSNSDLNISGGSGMGCGFIKPSGPRGGGPSWPVHFGILGSLVVYFLLRKVRRYPAGRDHALTA